ncbi:N-6 DNA methylase, partial [Candidatus Poribacteria bacterium]|nr:N-6 DNA methylase [Candidatus Poribacteria bacterium]
TVAYGLFAARCAAPIGMNFSRQSAADLVPKTNPFLRKLFQQVAAHDLDDRVAWIADDIAQLLAHAPMADILTDFGARTKQEDPVVHFYETFLAAYDSHLREVRGVYYTPEPVVSYIVRSIDHLLRTHFHKPMGLADEHTLILDPATGTGSFLFAVVNQIRQTVTHTVGAGGWSGYVPKHLLPRLYGFELLIAPYAVAHLKLGLLLQESGYDFHGNQRVGIYLTNTLDAAVKRSELLWGRFISDEANEASAIKQERPILVVLGNPPYSGHSVNRSRDEKGKLTFIGGLIEDYKQVDGKPLGERNPKWLQDDYVKFIRFAQWRIEQTGEGIIGYITNHGYLDNPTFRGMRQHLMQTFNAICVYNLHGNSKKKERTPDGGKDENVFDIQQGVAILLCLKEKGNASPARVYHADLWGLREGKYQTLAETDVSQTQWEKLDPSSPFYLFVPQNTELRAEYEQWWKITEGMPENVLGFQTHRDHFAIDFDETVLHERIATFRDTKLIDDEVREQFDLGSWDVGAARSQLRTDEMWDQMFTTCLYRPFDARFCYYSSVVMDRPRPLLLNHVLDQDNLCLLSSRQQATLGYRHCWVARDPANDCVVSTTSREANQVFPLYLYPNPDELSFDTERRPNFSPAFLKALSDKLSLQQTQPHGIPEGIGPEDIFHYAYAVFHSPTYRERYAEFLKIDFPRLPLTSDLELFRALAARGLELVSLHLLDTEAAPVLKTPISPFPLAGGNEVERVRYDEAHRRVYINTTQYFEGVPPEVWEFCVGGYQVCEKWLKDRRGRQLSYDDLTHYQKIVVALRETIRLMGEIDAVIESWPIL